MVSSSVEVCYKPARGIHVGFCAPSQAPRVRAQTQIQSRPARTLDLIFMASSFALGLLRRQRGMRAADWEPSRAPKPGRLGPSHDRLEVSLATVSAARVQMKGSSQLRPARTLDLIFMASSSLLGLLGSSERDARCRPGTQPVPMIGLARFHRVTASRYPSDDQRCASSDEDVAATTSANLGLDLHGELLSLGLLRSSERNARCRLRTGPDSEGRLARVIA
jgi:hypothetical protein